jgi:CMP-N-acetylneuraminic acid synthetase
LRDGKYTGLIAVRKGSQRIPKKNIRDFCGTSLLEIKVNQALNCKMIDEVVVSSDCEIMLQKATALGAIASKREEKFCTSDVAMNDVYEKLAREIDCEHIVYLHVTSPLLQDNTLFSAIEKYKNLKNEYDSLATVEAVKKYLWHNKKPVNYDPNCHPRSQDLPEYYALNFAINILPRELMIHKKNIVGGSFYPYKISEKESVDVDTMHEFQIAEMFYKGDSD